MHFFEFKSKPIHYQYFLGNESNAIIIFIHGLGEHLGRIERWAQSFSPYNYTFCIMDLPGHGRSFGQRGYIRKISDFYDLIDLFIEQVKSDFPDKPIILYGHSMGGNIAANYVLKRNPSIKALILSSPWIELSIKPNIIQFYLGKLMYKIYPKYHDHTRLNPNFISRIPEEVALYKNDPLVHGRITPALFFPLFFKGKKLLFNASKIKIPTLIFHGTADQLTSPDASKKFASNHSNIEFKSYEGGYHELHHDLCRNELLENILDWMSVHVVMR